MLSVRFVLSAFPDNAQIKTMPARDKIERHDHKLNRAYMIPYKSRVILWKSNVCSCWCPINQCNT